MKSVKFRTDTIHMSADMDYTLCGRKIGYEWQAVEAEITCSKCLGIYERNRQRQIENYLKTKKGVGK